MKKGILIALLTAMALAGPTGCKEPNPETKIEYTDDGWNKDDPSDMMNKNGTLYDAQGYNREGYDADGFNREGFNASGVDREGYDKNGFKDGYDRDGFDKQGFGTDGFHKDTGLDREGFDREGFKDGYGRDGYDRDGFDKQGFGRDGFHKDTGLDHEGFDREGFDEDGYDINGYNSQGRDINNFTKIVPVPKPTMFSNDKITESFKVYAILDDGKSELATQANDIISKFNDPTIPTDQYPTGLKANIIAQCEHMRIYVGENITGRGDDIIGEGIDSISNYIVAMTNELPEGKRAKFTAVMEAYRTQTYDDTRTYDGMEPNHATNEIYGLYSTLRGMGINVNNSTQLNNYMENTYITELAVDLGLNPGLVKTLLNQIATVEQFYSLMDDARAQGFRPVTHGSVDNETYEQTYPVRTIEYMRQRMDMAQEQYDEQHQDD